MNRLPRTLFERLDPPAGGLEALRRRLAEERPRPAAAWAWRLSWGGAALAAVAAVALLLARPPLPPPEAPGCGAFCQAVSASGSPTLVVLGLDHPPTVAVEAAAPGLAVREVPTGRADVTFYWVGSVSGAGR